MTDAPTPRDGSALALEINAWLKCAGRQITPRFPPALEEFYGRETRAERVRAMKFSTIGGCFTGLLFAALIWPIMADAHTAILQDWLGRAIPLGLICHAILWHPRPRAITQEWQVAVFGIAVGFCLLQVMASSQFALPSFNFGGIMLLIMLDACAARLSVRPAAFVVLGLVALFALGLPRMEAGASAPPLAAALIILLMLTCALYALYGNWRLETEVRRSYALALRERLERHELTRRNAELGQMLGDDALTGLANRRAFDQLLAQAWSDATTHAACVSLVMVDVDWFKAYNDSYGHPAGDTCLRKIACCLREHMRGTTDLVARLGGEEFAVLLPGLDEAATLAAAERLRQAVQALAIAHRGAPGGVVTISAGAATMYAEPGSRPAQLIEAADQALYGAKNSGRNRVNAARWGAALSTAV